MFPHIRRLLLLLLLFPTGILQAQSSATAPDAVAYQGFIRQSGIPVNTPKDITIQLFDDASGGNLVWDRTYAGVPVENGVFNLALEGGDGEGANTDSLGAVSFGSPLWIQTTVAGEIVGGRSALTSVPYALSLRNLRVVPSGSVTHPGTVNLIGGSSVNSVSATVEGATISGGGSPSTYYGWSSCAVSESILANFVGANYGTIGGGIGNRACAMAKVGGGYNNAAIGEYTFVGGGSRNEAGGNHATVSGGVLNSASGRASTVPGGYENHARGDYSFSAGYEARAKHEGTFVWNDRSITYGHDSLVSTGDNQFLIRAAGGVGIGTNDPSNQLTVYGGNIALQTPDNALDQSILFQNAGSNYTWRIYRRVVVSNTASLRFAGGANSDPDMLVDRLTLFEDGRVGINTSTPTNPLEVGTDATNGNKAHVTAGGTWTSTSSRTVKEGFEDIDTGEILKMVTRLPLQKWRYKGSDEGDHIGPMSEDFRAAFGLGHTDKAITMVDADGVALAAIQGLYDLVQEKEEENQELRDRLNAQEHRLTILEKKMEDGFGTNFEH